MYHQFCSLITKEELIPMGRETKNMSGRRTRGHLDPFLNTPLHDSVKSINRAHNTVCLQSLEECRDQIKDAGALHALDTVRSIRKSEKWVITQKSQDIIEQVLIQHQNPHDVGFFLCVILFFNEEIPHVTEINTDCACCNSNNDKLRFAQFKQNCMILLRRWITPIRIKLGNHTWSNTNNDMLLKYQAIDTVLPIFCDYIAALCIGNLPKNICSEVYAEALKYDSKLASIYHFDPSLGIYSLTKKTRLGYSCVSQECATAIFMSNK